MRKALLTAKILFKSTCLDKVLLVAAAVIVLAALLGLMILTSRVLGLSKQWSFFVLGSLLYTMCGLYLLFKATSFHSAKFGQKVAALSCVGFPILAFFCIFCFGFLPLTDHMWPYWLGGLILAPTAILCIELCFKWDRR